MGNIKIHHIHKIDSSVRCQLLISFYYIKSFLKINKNSIYFYKAFEHFIFPLQSEANCINVSLGLI